MGKGKNPRKRREPRQSEATDSEKEVERQTEEKTDLVPPMRRPPTAVAAETPPPPPPAPRREPARVSQRRPALFQLIQALRLAAGAVLDLADATAQAIQRGLESGQPRRD